MQDLRDQAGGHGHFSANSHRYDSARLGATTICAPDDDGGASTSSSASTATNTMPTSTAPRTRISCT